MGRHQHLLTGCDCCHGLPAMDDRWREQSDSTVMVIMVVPLKERVRPRTGIFRTARAGKLWYTAFCASSTTPSCWLNRSHIAMRLPALKLFAIGVERWTMYGAAIHGLHRSDLFYTHRPTRQ